MSRTRTITAQVSLTSEEWRTIRELAKLRKLTTSDFVREAMHLQPLSKVLEQSPPPVRQSPSSLARQPSGMQTGQ